MQSGSSSLPSGVSSHSSLLGDLVRRQIRFVIGLTVLAGLVLAIAALATWNVTDPSFSNANGAVPNNALGFTGAAFADMIMQFFGLAGVVGLLPALFWAIGLLRNRPVDRMSRRGAAWFGGAWLTAALFGLLPRTESWPLPNGLGGVLGDMALKIPSAFTGGFPSGLVAVILGLLIAPVACWLLLFGAGLTGGAAVSEPGNAPVAEEEDDGDEVSSGSLMLGALTHAVFTARGHVRRMTGLARLKKLRAMPESPFDLNDGHAETGDDLYQVAPVRPNAERIEPGFGPAVRRQAVAVDDAPPFDMEDEALPEGILSDDLDYDDDPASDWQPQAAPAPSRATRISAPAERPKPGGRVHRDAQGSMLDDQGFSLPSVHLLSEAPSIAKDSTLSPQALEQNARMLEGVLQDFGVKGEIIHVRPGPVVTLYELEPAPGIKSSRVIGLADDIARSMSAIAVRVAVVPGRNAIGIELPNQKRETVYLREMIASRDFETSKAKLGLALGKTIGGEPVIADLAKMPHVLVAGTTGSGKSVAINTMILSILYRMDPSKCRLIMIDPKMLELSVYDGIPHLLTPVVTDPKKAVVALKWTVREMEQRYKNMSKIGVRNIDGFNSRVEQARASGEPITRTVQTGFDRDTGEAVYETEEFDLTPLPYIVVLIDEMADLMMVAGKDIEGAVQRLAQMARAAGIHVIMATQRPSVDVITGTIKANFPTRISFQVTSKIDSRTILGEQGAEQLLGMGDMLYMAGGGRIQRVHGPFVSDKEVEDIVSFLKTQGVPEYLDAITEEDEEGDSGNGPAGTGNLADSDDPYDQAVAIVLRDGKASTSYIQRRLGIGYNRAASLIERMENEGVISAANHAGKREILVPTEDEIDPR
ncbi:S-DNA-T family DNA segregation ATPase FtsK/SpoIIIE [Hoeflea halophila]|uniref:DNA translocase FtsK n=1 Tax=Hoeflea halophila TaxID=714899 RepID=A0A286IA16_9HYPH|nr:DNA translocase FtsK [Hoeflea halophila]SOE16902.1 S-DNA-T family DNA segregation ATPase FtsK/SpoIIIE [Hoeflea halophila]